MNRLSPPLRSDAGLLPWLTWRYSALFVVAVVGLLATFVWRALFHDDASTVDISVIDATSSQPVAGAMVIADGREYITNDGGVVTLPGNAIDDGITVSADGYESWTGPVGNVTLSTSAPEALVAGHVIPDNLDATAVSSSESSAHSETPPPAAGASPPAATAASVEGVITGVGGKPLQGARVVVDGMFAVTGKDGRFTIEASGTNRARVIAAGYEERLIDLAPGENLEIALDPYQIRALYMNPAMTTTDEDVDRLIQIIDDTELNAIVLDIKEEIIFYDSQVPFFVDNGIVAPRYDVEDLIERFHSHGIYVIARLVVFKDSLIAERNPYLAVLNNQTGDLWRDDNGVAWVNPMVHELWDANTDLALEAANIGFDEIQFDYVRFPTDGDYSTMDFGLENTQENREISIEKFLARAQEKIYPTGAKISADVFGYTMLVDDDLGIGQNFAELAQYVDYLSPMIYPSHFPNGSIAVDGHPNDYPYETIEISMRLGRAKLDGDATQIRPWLQDFSFFDLMPYGDEEVRAQIDATNDVGASGYMLWDPDNIYHPGALGPEDGTQGVLPLGTDPDLIAPRATPEIRRRWSTRGHPAAA